MASFASQYQKSEADIAEMDWTEFSALLHGIMPKTPLGLVVQIRAEEDKDILKHFTKEQQAIRNEWRSKQIRNVMTEAEKKRSIENLQGIFAEAYGPESMLRR